MTPFNPHPKKILVFPQGEAPKLDGVDDGERTWPAVDTAALYADNVFDVIPTARAPGGRDGSASQPHTQIGGFSMTKTTLTVVACATATIVFSLARAAYAAPTCTVRVDHTGKLIVSAKPIMGTTVSYSLDDGSTYATTLKDGKNTSNNCPVTRTAARTCVLGAAAAVANTPPASCDLFVRDDGDNSTGSCHIRGCTPGVRSLAGTSANVPNTLVERDGLGNFSAGTVTAALNGTINGIAVIGGVLVSSLLDLGGVSGSEPNFTYSCSRDNGYLSDQCTCTVTYSPAFLDTPFATSTTVGTVASSNAAMLVLTFTDEEVSDGRLAFTAIGNR